MLCQACALDGECAWILQPSNIKCLGGAAHSHSTKYRAKIAPCRQACLCWNMKPTSGSQSLPDTCSSVQLVVGGCKGGLVGEGGGHSQGRPQAAEGGCQQQQLADARIHWQLCQVVPCRLKWCLQEHRVWLLA